MFHETRVLMHKKVVEPRELFFFHFKITSNSNIFSPGKKHLSSSEIDLQLQPFNHAIKTWASEANVRIRDEIVKALRSIPKRLIKKRNDKLMDYEASRTKEKGLGVQLRIFIVEMTLNQEIIFRNETLRKSKKTMKP